jgi:hypothetical protein
VSAARDEPVTLLVSVALISEPGIGANNNAAPTPTPTPAAKGNARDITEGLGRRRFVIVSTSCPATPAVVSRRLFTALSARADLLFFPMVLLLNIEAPAWHG